MSTRATVVSIAAAEIGYKEGPNNDTKYGKWYGMNFQPWCAMFDSWVFAMANLADLICRFAYVPDGVKWFKARNQWHPRGDGYIPRPGDVAFFGTPPSTGAHTGIVEKAVNGVLYTIEGNTSASGNSSNGDGVYRRTRSLNDSWIMGYGVPAYEEDDEMSYDQFKKYMDDYLEETANKPASNYNEDDLAWAVENGLFTGDSKGRMKWRSWVNRQDMAILCHRLFKLITKK